VRDRLEGAERLVELLALLRVLHRDLERALGAAHGLRREQHDAGLQRALEAGPAALRRADARGGRHAHAVERELVLGVGAERELLLLRDPRRRGIDEEEVDLLVAGPRAREHEELRRCARESDVALLPVEPEPVSVRCGPQLHAARAEGAVRLEPGRRDDRLARRDAREPRLLLRLAAGVQQDRRRQDGAREVRGRRERAAELFVHDHGLEQRLPRAAEDLGDQDPRHADLGELLPERLGKPDRIVLGASHHLDRGVLGEHAAQHVA
jgi:hypothetical protein